MPKVFITRQIPEAGIKMLEEKGFSVKIGPQAKPTRAELLAGVKGTDAILSVLTERIDAEVMEAAGPQLKIIANFAVGFDNIDVAEAKKRGIIVTNTPTNELTEAVAEHTIALIMALARRIPEANQYAKAEKYHGWDPALFCGLDLYNKTLGIVGFGRIGRAVAARAAHGLRMNVVYADPAPDQDFDLRYHTEHLPLEKLLQQADFVSLHTPLLPSTRHLISTSEFSLMKHSVFLINTARGPVVDEKALLRALRTGRIAGAALDVFECEPAIDCDLSDKLELKSFPNVILTPHIASATFESRASMSRCAAANIIAFFENGLAPNAVK